VFVGDAMEETLDKLSAGAGELALRGVPAFMFQEGYDPVCEQPFREIARLTRGAYCRFAPAGPKSTELRNYFFAGIAEAEVKPGHCRVDNRRAKARLNSHR
jgi:hypothetical protein